MNNQNSIQQKLEDIVIDALKGASVQYYQLKLVELAEYHQKNPLELFSEKNYTAETTGLDRILKILAPNRVKDLTENFHNHCHNLNIPHNLINFLEFLTHQSYHRLHPHIHLIKKFKPIQPSYGIYTLGAFCIFIGTSVLMGIFHAEIWNQMLDCFLKHGQEILQFLLKHIWIAENIAFLTLLYRLADFASKCYKIYNNHATTTENKINKMIKTFLVDSLIIVAQGLLYANKGFINPISAYLFMTSSFVELAYSAISLYKLSKPVKPLVNPEDSQELQLANEAHFQEENAYYQRTLGRCYHELWAFALIAVGTVVTITFSNHLLMIGIIIVIFQFMVSQLKDYAIFQKNKAINQQLQKNLQNLYTSHSSSSLQNVDIIQTPTPSIENTTPNTFFKENHRLFKPCTYESQLNDFSPF